MKPPVSFSEALYGETGANGWPASAAETMAGSFYGPVSNAAAVGNHPGDAQALKTEARELGSFLHKDFTQVEAEAFTRALSPWVRPNTYVADDDTLARSELAGAKALHKKFGAVDSAKLLKDAHVALRHIVKQAPTLKRTLIENGGANDPAVIEHLANLARSKKWK